MIRPCPLVALLRHPATSANAPLLADKRTLGVPDEAPRPSLTHRSGSAMVQLPRRFRIVRTKRNDDRDDARDVAQRRQIGEEGAGRPSGLSMNHRVRVVSTVHLLTLFHEESDDVSLTTSILPEEP